MEFDAEFFVALGFVLFVVLLGYLGVHRKLVAALDERTRKVERELAEAKRLREEAQAILGSFEKRRAEAEAEAQELITNAQAEADRMAKEAAERMADFVTRRTKQAEGKIAMAEAQAAADVRAAAADAAVRAAETVLRGDMRSGTGAELVSRGIGDIQALARH